MLIKEYRLNKKYYNETGGDSVFLCIVRGEAYIFDSGSETLVDDIHSFFDEVLPDNDYLTTEDFFHKPPKDTRIDFVGTIFYDAVGDVNIRGYSKVGLDVGRSDLPYKLKSLLKGADAKISINNKEYDKIRHTKRDTPKILYHGTSLENAIVIAKEGIRPGTKGNFPKTEHKKYVFFTTDFNTAKFYAKISYSNSNSQNIGLVVFELDGSRFDTSKIVDDFDYYLRYKQDNSNPDYENLIRSGNIDSPVYPDVKMPSNTSKIGYAGIVQPSKILYAYVFDNNYSSKYTRYTIDEFNLKFGERQIAESNSTKFKEYGIKAIRKLINDYIKTSPPKGLKMVGYHASDAKMDGFSNFLIDCNRHSKYISDLMRIDAKLAKIVCDNMANKGLNLIYVSEEPFPESEPNPFNSQEKKKYKYGKYLYEVYLDENEVEYILPDRMELANNSKAYLLKTAPYLKKCESFEGKNGMVATIRNNRLFLTRN